MSTPAPPTASAGGMAAERARRVDPGAGTQLASRQMVRVIEQVAAAPDLPAAVQVTVAAAARLPGVEAAAFVRGAGEVLAASGRVVRPSELVRRALAVEEPSTEAGTSPAQVCWEPVAGVGGALAGRLVVVHRLRAGLDEPGRASVLSLALVLGLGLQGLAARQEARRLERPVTLTGLPGRVELLDRIEHALARRSAAGHRVAVLVVDIDRFKTVNDGLGHDAGDELLSMVGARLRSCIRPEDSAAHLDGDEFGLLLVHHAGHDEVLGVADRVRDALREPYRLRRNAAGHEARDVHLDASVGVAMSEDASPSGQDLLHNADLAMARAKADGRARVVFYEQGMLEAAVARSEIEGRLRTALADGALSVHYQPIHRLSDGAMKGVEALVRWRDPVLGSVPPSSFIPIAEQTDLIEPIGAWVLATACAQVVRWRRSGLAPNLTVSVNLSTRQLSRDGLTGEVAEVLARTGLPAAALVLEVTESVLVADVRAASEQLSSLRRLGVRVAIDDFGTGYATLAYLKQLPLDILKIDKCFVDDLCLGAERSALARAVVQLGGTLGLRTTAEGIESPDQLDVLRALGCDDGQGYLFSRPLAAAALERRLAEAPATAG